MSVERVTEGLAEAQETTAGCVPAGELCDRLNALPEEGRMEAVWLLLAILAEEVGEPVMDLPQDWKECGCVAKRDENLGDALRGSVTPVQYPWTPGCQYGPCGCGVRPDGSPTEHSTNLSVECSWECHGCKHMWEDRDMGATYPMCEEGCTSREACGRFEPSRHYLMMEETFGNRRNT